MELTITKFMELINNVKIFHWKTKSYAEHKASDSLHGSLQSHLDKFAEVYLGGAHTRFNFSTKRTIHIVDHSKKEICSYVKEFIQHMDGLKLSGDLSNIREDIIATCNQFLYLMTLD